MVLKRVFVSIVKTNRSADTEKRVITNVLHINGFPVLDVVSFLFSQCS